MAETTPEISIIMPTYQGEATLPRCLDSLLQQTFSNIEIIVVDDGSTDQTPQIMQKYLQADKRIVYLRQENKGVSTARNKGLEAAKGSKVVFVDSDDWVDKDYVESLMPDDEETDLTVSGFIRHDADKKTHKNPQETKLLPMQQAEQCIYILEKGGFLNMPWSKMYSKAIIDKHGITFPPQYSYGEDKLFLFNYLIHCNNIQIKAGNSYHYITAEQGLSARRHPMEKIWSWNEELLETYSKLGSRFGFSSDTIKKMCSRSYTYFTLYMANTIFYEPHSNKQRVSLIRKIYNRRRDANLLNRKECRGIVRKAAAMLYDINLPLLTNAIYNMVCTKQGKGMMR